MTKVLGIDISSSCSGFCIVVDGYLDYKSLGTIEPPSKISIGEKLVYFEKTVKKLIKKYSPDFIVVEDIFKGPSVTVFKLLAMFRGVAFKVGQEKMKKDPISVMPSEARRLVGAGITKEDAFDFVVKKYKFKNFTFNKHNDITDSIILALAYFNLSRRTIKKQKRKKKR